MRVVRSFVFLAAMIAPLSARAQSVPEMAGTWFGQDTIQKPGMMTQWILTLAPDGSYKTRFQSYQDCKLMTRSFDEGNMSFEGKVQVAAQTYYNGSASTMVHRYEMIEFSGDKNRYRSLRTGNEYEQRRVVADFQFPGCSGPAS